MEDYQTYGGYLTEKSATSSGAYENYDSNDALSPYEMLNRMKSWNKAIYLHVEDLDSQTQAKLTIMNDRITTEVTDVKNEMWAQFNVQADMIESKVAKVDYNGNVISSLINQTATTILIQAEKIRLIGNVALADITGSGATVIDGSRIHTGTLNADRIQSRTITASQIATGTITADQIAAFTITASEIASNAIQANHIQAGAINAGHIQAYSITAGLISSGAIQAHHISAGAISADMIQTGYLSADRIYGGTISGVNINVDTNIYMGNALYFNGGGGYTFIDCSGGGMDLQAWNDVHIGGTQLYFNGSRVLTEYDLSNIYDYINSVL